MSQPRTPTDGAWVAISTAGVMIAQQVGGKATRDALFLTSFDARQLPAMVLGAVVASLIAVVVASRLFARFGPARVVPVAFVTSGALHLGEFALQLRSPSVAAVLLYLHTSVFGALLISGFWSVVNERFDPNAARHLMGRIGTGATAGGVIGGVVAMGVGSTLDASVMLVLLAGLNLMAGAGVFRLGDSLRGTPADPRASDSSGEQGGVSALELLRKQPYLQALAALIFVTATSAALLDYAFKAEADAVFAPAQLLTLFAVFHTVTAILSLFAQTVLADRLIQRLGVGGAVSLLPGSVFVASLFGTVLPHLAYVVAARGVELVLANSVFRSGYELLYTPVSPEEKRPTKAVIDVVGNRIGDAAGSGLVLAVLALVPAFGIAGANAHDSTVRIILSLAAGLAVLGVLVAVRLNGGYVGQLKRSLQSGAGDRTDVGVMDAATLQTLSTLGLDRAALIEQLMAQKSWSTSASRSGAAGLSAPPGPVEAPEDDPVHAHAELLRSGSGDDIRSFLRDVEDLDDRLVPHAIALLARRDVYHAAIAALRQVAERSAPELGRAIADPDQPFAIRRRLPRVLEVTSCPEAIDGLLSGLEDERFEVRYRCAIALARIVIREPEKRLPPERILRVVEEELKAGRKVWDSRRLLDDDSEEDAPLMDRALRDRVQRSVEHVFTLLSLAYDPEPLRLSLFALAEDDRRMRGTALEYLESVLPEGTRTSLFPMLDARVEAAAARPARSREAIVQELVQSMQSINAKDLERAIQRRRDEGDGGA